MHFQSLTMLTRFRAAEVACVLHLGGRLSQIELVILELAAAHCAASLDGRRVWN